MIFSGVPAVTTNQAGGPFSGAVTIPLPAGISQVRIQFSQALTAIAGLIKNATMKSST